MNQKRITLFIGLDKRKNVPRSNQASTIQKGIFLGLFGCCLITEKCLGIMGLSNGGLGELFVCFIKSAIRVWNK